MAYTKQKQSSPAPSAEALAQGVSRATGGIISQTTLGNSFLSGLIGAGQSIAGVPETCAESAEDSWLENAVEGALGWLGIGNDPDKCEDTTEPAPEPSPVIEVPPVDLTPYRWLIGVYVRSEALSQEDAEGLLTAASLEQLAATLAVGASDYTAPENAGALPEASIGEDDNNRARPLDWDAPVAAGHIRPEGSDTEPTGPSLRAVFEGHLADTMVEEFGAGTTLEQVRGAIALAESLGRAGVAAHLQARLSRANQYALVSTLNVEDSGRYAANGATTYCNIYAFDFVTAMGAYIPRTWWYDSVIRRIQAGEQAISQSEYEARLAAGQTVSGFITPIYAQTVREMDADSLNAWMQTWGGSFGWQRAGDMTAAQEAANAGSVVVIQADGSGVPGHISVVLPEKDGLRAARDANGAVTVPLQSQAGALNANHDSMESSQGQWWSDALHTDGAAWINSGSASSPILTPESLGR